MHNPGYIMVDCKEMDLTKGQIPQTISGLYKRVQAAMETGKPIFATNTIWGTGKPVSPIQTFAIQLLEDTVVCTASTLQIWINEEDTVSIANMVGE